MVRRVKKKKWKEGGHYADAKTLIEIPFRNFKIKKEDSSFIRFAIVFRLEWESGFFFFLRIYCLGAVIFVYHQFLAFPGIKV